MAREPHPTELNNYIDTSVTVAKAIRWLTFALSLCSASLLLLLATHYFGNLKYAIERRKAIQEHCFEQNPDPQTQAGKQCIDFVYDTWEKELKFLPTPTPTPTPIPTTTPTPTSTPTALTGATRIARARLTPPPTPTPTPAPPPMPTPPLTEDQKKGIIFDAHKKEVKAYNAERIKSFRDLEGETRIITLPLINLKLFNTDFAPVLVLLSLFFLYWLRLNLEFARNTLCSLFNEVSSAYQAIRTIPAHFILLWPGGSRRRSHWIFWAVLYSLIVSVLLLVFSDIYDFFRIGKDHLIPISQQAGWEKYSFYAWGKMIVEGLLLGVAGYIIWRSQSIVRDVRNLLMLIEWSPRAFYPLIYHLYGEDTLLKGYNEASYDEYDTGFFCLRIRLTFSNGTDDQTSNDGEELFFASTDLWNDIEPATIVAHDEELFFASIDLWNSASNKISYARSVDKEYLFSDEDWAKSTADEREMRYFFFNILTNPYIEKELCYEFWKVSKERLQGQLMEECTKEFDEQKNIPKNTANERIQPKEHFKKW